jgi:malonyl-CoA/methylmalonyl-CoA synthetase
MYWLNKFDPLKVLEHIDQCSVLMGVPTFYTRLLSTEKITHDNCKNMRVFISGSAPLLEETFNDFETMTGHKILERYGMTETNMNTSNPIDGARKPGTVGPPLPGIEIQIVDDDGKKVGDNVIGNLLVRGPNVFKGYWKMPEKTAEDFTAQGFFKTGDKAKIDADGYISIVGRSKDMIITGGLNVYPKEIELIIDDIQGVKESAVIGVYHKDFGEAVIAIVICSDTSALKEIDIIEYCKQHLAGYKIPKKVIFANELPRNTMSKVQKNILRENHKNSFNL